MSDDIIFPGQIQMVEMQSPFQSGPPKLLIPYCGRVDIVDGADRVDLWSGRDDRFEEQPVIASTIWITADPNNVNDIYLGSEFVVGGDGTGRGKSLQPGEQLPPMGPLHLKQWFVVGTANDGLHFLYISLFSKFTNIERGEIARGDA